MTPTPEAPKETAPNPDVLTGGVREKLERVRAELSREASPAAPVALARLKSDISRTELAREIKGLQNLPEYAGMTAGLRGQIESLQRDVESTTEMGARMIEQNVINPANAAVDKLPGWAKLSILGAGVGSTLYAGYKFGGTVVSGAWNMVKSFFRKTGVVLAGIGIGALGLLGYQHYTASEAPKEEPKR